MLSLLNALAGFGDRFLRNETGHHFEKRLPVTWLPFYNLNVNVYRSAVRCGRL